MLLIDCYNVLHAALPPMLAGLDEAGLCAALGRTQWAKRGTAIVVVADGSPKPLRASVSPVESVELVFSGGTTATGGHNADAVIIQRIEEATTPRRLTVVSSDREIRAAAARRRCRSWTAEHFINQLCEQLRAARGNAPKTEEDASRVQVDALPEDHVAGWMEEMGLTEDDAEGMQATPRPPTADAFDLEGLDMEALEREWGFGVDDEPNTDRDEDEAGR